MNTRDEIIASVVGIEGGYVDDKADSGGKTRWGITKKVARVYGYKGKIRKLPKQTALDIYGTNYWDKVAGAALLAYGGGELAHEVFEQAVNMGVGRASRNLQRVLNSLNNRGSHYEDLRADGQIGNATVRALKAYTRKRGGTGIKVLTSYLNALQGAFYISLSENRGKDERFVYGWGLNRVVT